MLQSCLKSFHVPSLWTCRTNALKTRIQSVNIIKFQQLINTIYKHIGHMIIMDARQNRKENPKCSVGGRIIPIFEKKIKRHIDT